MVMKATQLDGLASLIAAAPAAKRGAIAAAFCSLIGADRAAGCDHVEVRTWRAA
jgi:hypothetical protein